MKKIVIFMFLISTLGFSAKFIGTAKDEKYGYTMKIEVEMDSKGKISQIKVLENTTYKSVSKKSIPKLIENAIKTNSANIDSVAGASITSGLFKNALKDALKKK